MKEKEIKIDKVCRGLFMMEHKGRHGQKLLTYTYYLLCFFGYNFPL